MSDVYCCSCGNVIPDDGQAAILAVDYTVPGEEPMNVHAVCCNKCSAEYDKDSTQQVIQMLISVKLARVRNPDKSWKKDGG
jgi:hypothetical protein